MNLHEYQAKALIANYGIAVPKHYIAHTSAQALEAFSKLQTPSCIAKVQIHAGGRGKAGGVKLIHSPQELQEFADKLLGKYLPTYQTDLRGQLVNILLIEEPCSIAKELYLGMVIDRTSQKIVIMASTQGGMEIEKVAIDTPEKILYIAVEPLCGLLSFQVRKLAVSLGLSSSQAKQFEHILQSLLKMFVEQDLSLLEINPLVITMAGDLLCLDAKINIDENALYRHPDLAQMHDVSQENEREVLAKQHELNYVSLDGNIGCMVNGAGLAMATMDLIKLRGGNPANFLDVGGGATAERVTKAFEIILSDSKVTAILVNIFGGIVRCDLIAEGIIVAVKNVGVRVPVVVRLEGNRATQASKILQDSGLNIIAANSFDAAAIEVVKVAGGLA
jgi:succinyl-CoA synthetase beta subunit